MSPEERAQAQADVRQTLPLSSMSADKFKMRAKQQAALDKRLASQPKPTKTASGSAQPTNGPRKPNALEQLSRENVGWRNADAQAELRSWN